MKRSVMVKVFVVLLSILGAQSVEAGGASRSYVGGYTSIALGDNFMGVPLDMNSFGRTNGTGEHLMVGIKAEWEVIPNVILTGKYVQEPSGIVTSISEYGVKVYYPLAFGLLVEAGYALGSTELATQREIYDPTGGKYGFGSYTIRTVNISVNYDVTSLMLETEVGDRSDIRIGVNNYSYPGGSYSTFDFGMYYSPVTEKGGVLGSVGKFQNKGWGGFFGYSFPMDDTSRLTEGLTIGMNYYY